MQDRSKEAKPEMLTSLLEDLDAGVFQAKIAAALKEAAIGTNAHRRKGTVTVTFTMEPIGDSSQIKCTHALKAITPTAKGKITVENTTNTPLYVSGKGELSLFPVQEQERMFERDGTPRSTT